MEKETHPITDEEYEQFLNECPKSSSKRIGNKQQAIEALKSLGWGKYGIDRFKNEMYSDGGHPIKRIGTVYYWNVQY